MVEFFTTHGSYLGIVCALVLTGAGLPIPEELIVVFAAITSHQGVLHPGLAFLACLAGAVGGDCVMYGIGRFFGKSVLRDHPWCARFLTPARERYFERMIARHGLKVFFVSRFLVGVRSPVYLTAGILRVPFQWFFLIDALCATVVISLFFALGYIFSERIYGWLEWIQNAELALSVSVVALVVALAVLFYWRRRRRWARLLMRRAAGRRRAATAGTSKSERDIADENPPANTQRRSSVA